METFVKSVCKWLKGAFTLIVAIPSIAAVIEVAYFGFTWNQAVISPFTKPFISCHNFKLEGTDGGYLIYRSEVTVSRPIYLIFLWKKLSMQYQLNLEGIKGFTFNQIGDLGKSDGLLLIERRFSSEAHIAKSLHFSHRFMDKNEFKFEVTGSGPSPWMEDECPFVYSSQY